MECIEIRSHLSAYVDGFLDPQTKNLVEEHVSTCKACRQTLESLQSLVQELSDLKQVKAPDDFLEQVHFCMTKRFDFHAWMKKMFVPLRLKIQYTFATAAAMAVLMFFIIHMPQMKKEIKDFNAPDEIHEREAFTDSHKMPRLSRKNKTLVTAPNFSKERQLTDQDSKNQFTGSVHAIKSKRTVPKVKGSPGASRSSETVSFQKDAVIKAEAKPSTGEAVEVVELYLVLRTDIFLGDAGLQPSHDMGIITAPEKGGSEALTHSVGKTMPMFKSRNMKRNRLDEFQPKPDPSEMAGKPSEKSFTANDTFSDLKNIIGSLNGNVLSAEYDQDTGQLKFLNAEIPSDQYELFCDKLHDLGTPQSPLTGTKTKDIERIQIRIHLIRS